MGIDELDRSSIDHVLTTTRGVRRRLDLDRSIPLDLVHACLEIALQAPTGFNLQNCRLVVTNPDNRAAIAQIVRRIELPFLVAMEDDVPADDDDAQRVAASAAHGGIWPAAWSFMLALCSCGLVSSLTMIHLGTEPEAGRVLDLPDTVSQAGLILVAYFQGEDCRPGPRRPRWRGRLPRPVWSATGKTGSILDDGVIAASRP